MLQKNIKNITTQLQKDRNDSNIPIEEDVKITDRNNFDKLSVTAESAVKIRIHLYLYFIEYNDIPNEL